MRPTDFIKKHRAEKVLKALSEGALPEQGSYVSFFNNDYKILTKADAQICILEDIKGNKVPYHRSELLKLLKKAKDEKSDLMKGDGQPPTGGVKKQTFNVGDVHNGRKKIVSPRTGKTMWVDMTHGHAYGEHNSDEVESDHGVKEQIKHFFDSVGDKIHPSDKMKILRQMKEVMSLKAQISNLKQLASHDLANKQDSAKINRDKMFTLQDRYSLRFKRFKEALVQSAKKRKAEGI